MFSVNGLVTLSNETFGSHEDHSVAVASNISHNAAGIVRVVLTGPAVGGVCEMAILMPDDAVHERVADIYCHAAVGILKEDRQAFTRAQLSVL